jgi:ABC-type antimicrobial peptide transport system permease subunit
LLTGRNFTDGDTNNAPLVLIVNQTFIRKYIRTPSPLGQHVHVRPEPQYPERTYEIVGTIPDTKYGDLRDDTPPMAFAPIDQFPVTAQGPGIAMMFAARDCASAVETVRRMFEQRHAGTIMQFYDFEQGIRDNLVGDRMMALLSGFFGILAALLVVVGLYGVLTYFLAQRRGEIGIRIALGASRGRVIRGLLAEAVTLLLVGLVAGTGLALLAGREASSMLFGLKPWDPMVLAASALLLGIVTLLSSIVPALRAANVDPISSLRAE